MPVLLDWIKTTLPEKPFIYHDRASRQGAARDPIYAPLVESIKVEDWHDLDALPNLWHLGLDRGRALETLALGDPVVIFNAFRVLSVEANLEHFLNQSLVYCVNVVLHQLYRPPITIVPHVPFTAPSLREGTVRSEQCYTPDYTVYQGYIEEDPQLLDDHRASLLVGDIKLIGPKKPEEAIGHTESLSWSALGQLLWYCVRRQTRFAFHVSDRELVLMEFVVGHEKSVTALSDAVARAEYELGSPGLALPTRHHSQPGKRKYTGSSANTSNVSPSDRHHQKRMVDVVQATDEDESPASSPFSGHHRPRPLSQSSDPGQQPQEAAPQTPEPAFNHPEHSSSYTPSSSGKISIESIRDLAFAGGDFTVRLHSFPFRKRERLPLALLGFITLAQLVNTKGPKNISATSTSIKNYFADVAN
ncbi:hypothetical protein F5Y16DRAFT_396551 [Xylariaceae sp. FL0255]|nr:hypothetical protein F5Y16DRAFT_396551 [Xylariaceae sp. FL0255]